MKTKIYYTFLVIVILITLISVITSVIDERGAKITCRGNGFDYYDTLHHGSFWETGKSEALCFRRICDDICRIEWVII